MFNYSVDIIPTTNPLGFQYGETCFGPEPELRTLDAIRPSLKNPNCDGPEIVYAIAMDVGDPADRSDLNHRNLLFGVVTYAAGRLGREPVRSQGHIHAVSASCGGSTAEVYEIWQGRAVILMQEFAEDDPGRCFSVSAGPGEVVVVPPRWAHATLSADPAQALTFGAWCVRDFGFDYRGVRAHGGLAWFPELEGENLHWLKNPAYLASQPFVEKSPSDYSALGLTSGTSIYEQYQQNRDRFDFVPNPDRFDWANFTP